MSILGRKTAAEKAEAKAAKAAAKAVPAPPAYTPVYEEPDSAKADNAIRRFWGASNGSEADLADTEKCLRGCQLHRSDLHRLRRGLPVGAAGTTGSRVARIDRVLKSLEHEA